MTRTRLISLVGLAILAGGGAGVAVAVSGDSSSTARTASGAALTTGRTVSPAATGRTWAPTTRATIGPGVQTYTAGNSQCTANFVFVDAARHVYLGQAAHCAEVKESKSDGCHTATRPLGTEVTFNRGGFSGSSGQLVGTGTLAYDSWQTMARVHTRRVLCEYNDFALVRVDSDYADNVNPTVPHWGGPDGLNTAGTYSGERLYGYGNSSLRGGARQLSPQTGVAEPDREAADGWSHDLESPTPGVPGDSGSAWLDSRGRAVGTLSTLGLSLPIVNATGDIARELSYAQQHSGIKGLRLVLGTRRFRASS
jgi:hypothetical protein